MTDPVQENPELTNNSDFNHAEFNRQAWDAIATAPRKWFFPVTSDQVQQARDGQLKLKITATRDLPEHWLQPVRQKRILCLAAGGGHQGPLLAAAGADVTVADFSREQLAIDQRVADQENLSLTTVQCDMRDLGDIGPFDLVLNPCSVNFCDQVEKVWQEAARVLVDGGELITGFINPVNYLFDESALLQGRFQVCNPIPYTPANRENVDPESATSSMTPVEFGHSLTSLIGGQLAAGFHIVDFFEDRWGGDDPLSAYISVFGATRAVKQVTP